MVTLAFSNPGSLWYGLSSISDWIDTITDCSTQREHRHPISRKVAQAFDQEGKEAIRQQAHMCRRKPAQTDAESGARDERGAENTLFLVITQVRRCAARVHFRTAAKGERVTREPGSFARCSTARRFRPAMSRGCLGRLCRPSINWG
jgi:hypothetical protein